MRRRKKDPNGVFNQIYQKSIQLKGIEELRNPKKHLSDVLVEQLMQENNKPPMRQIETKKISETTLALPFKPAARGAQTSGSN